MSAPTLLNPDGTASQATLIMMSHHGMRRDVARLAAALRDFRGDVVRLEPLREGWSQLAAVLHGHHEAEDQGLFPGLREREPQLAAAIDRLSADHREIDPLIAKLGSAFAALPARRDDATTAMIELAYLLHRHLAFEEETIMPSLRSVALQPFPAMPEEALAQLTDGFAWSAEGIAPDIAELAFTVLPDAARARLGAARTAYAARCERVWGGQWPSASRTSVPEGLDALVTAT